MVLQRDRPIPVWGTAASAAVVKVQFCDKSATATADDQGRWMVRLPAMAADLTPRKLSVSSGEDAANVKDVLIGDVWLCSGQSNMQMTLGDSQHGKEFAAEHGDNARFRLLIVPKAFTDEKRSDQAGKWKVSTSAESRGFSAVGFSFAAFLSKSASMHDVPLGLIDCSFGGTAIEGWIPSEKLADFKPADIGPSLFGKASQQYNAMVAPLEPMALRGVVWYQGESNAGRPATYARFLQTLITSWRSEFEAPGLPFIIVQLPALDSKSGDYFFTWLREQQAKVAADDERVGLVVTYDTHDGTNLHPKEKIPVGKRCALLAERMVYGADVVARGPSFKSVKFEGRDAIVAFETDGARLKTRGDAKAVRGFMIAGSDGRFRFAEASLQGVHSVRLAADGITNPTAVRFAWSGVPDANLIGSSGLPAEPFRTDDFPPVDVAYLKLPPARHVQTTGYDATIDSRGSLVSLGVHGEQFISNDLGAAGGSCSPTWFGPRALAEVSELGPEELVFSDAELRLTYRFGQDSFTLELQNNSGGDVPFQIALANGVHSTAEKAMQLTRRKATLVVDGFEKVEHDGEKLLLKVSVPKGESKSMAVRLSK
jgi:sialate O-acetylesterase